MSAAPSLLAVQVINDRQTVKSVQEWNCFEAKEGQARRILFLSQDPRPAVGYMANVAYGQDPTALNTNRLPARLVQRCYRVLH